MRNLENRVAQLERAKGDADLNRMNDSQLSAYIHTLEGGTRSWWDDMLASVMRYPSALPVVVNDPDYAHGEYAID